MAKQFNPLYCVTCKVWLSVTLKYLKVALRASLGRVFIIEHLSDFNGDSL